MSKKLLKILRISPCVSNWIPREARILGDQIASENHRKTQEKTKNKETRLYNYPQKALTYPLIFPYIPLKEPQGSQEPWVSSWKPKAKLYA